MGNLELYEKLVTLVYALYYFMISGKFASSMDTLIKNGRKSGSRIRNDDITKDLKKRKREIQECTFDFMMKLAQIKLTLEYLYTGKQSYDSACEYIEAKHKSKGLLEAEKCCNSLNEKLMVSQSGVYKLDIGENTNSLEDFTDFIESLNVIMDLLEQIGSVIDKIPKRRKCFNVDQIISEYSNQIKVEAENLYGCISAYCKEISDVKLCKNKRITQYSSERVAKMLLAAREKGHLTAENYKDYLCDLKSKGIDYSSFFDSDIYKRACQRFFERSIVNVDYMFSDIIKKDYFEQCIIGVAFVIGHSFRVDNNIC